jgi:hypothetical protein
LRLWSSRTSSHEIANLLMEVLRHHASPGKVLLTLVAALVILPLAACLSYILPLWFVLPGAPLIYAHVDAVRRRRITQRAALMLARLNDERAIPYLTESWRETPIDRKTNATITEEITRLATQAYRRGETATGAETLRDFVARRFPLSSPRDLREAETDMFLAVLRLIGQSGNPIDQKTLEKISRLRNNKSNHELIIEAARLMVEPLAPPPIISLETTLPTETITPAIPQVQQNRRS